MTNSVSISKKDKSEENFSEYNNLISLIKGVIPDALFGSLLLSQKCLPDMPGEASKKLRQHANKTIICFAIPITEDSLWVWQRHGNHRSLMANYLLAKAADVAVSYLNKNGIPADELTRLVGEELSMVQLGELAGLGKRGWNNLLLHPEWGAWLQLHAIICSIAAPLNTDVVSDICIGCGNCVQACPVNAIKPDHFNANACQSVVASPTRLKSKAIGLTENSYIECRECISSCPIGKEPEGLFSWKR